MLRTKRFVLEVEKVLDGLDSERIAELRKRVNTLT
jgi:hypothetical protein